MSNEIVQRESLKKTLSRLDVLSLAFGTMTGWGWVMLAGDWISLAGVAGALIAFLFGGMMCMFVGGAYAELTPALPLAGGELVFSYRGLGYFWSWVCGWAICLAYVGVAAWEGIAIATAANYLVPFPQLIELWTINGSTVYLTWSLVGTAGAAIIMFINLIGVKQSAVFQNVGVVGVLAIGVVFLTGGAIMGDTSNLAPAFAGAAEGVSPWAGMFAVMMMAPGMFVGFDVIPQAAEEMKIPPKQIAGVVYISILMAIAWYVIVILATALCAPEEIRSSFEHSVPVAEVVAYAFGSPIWGKVLIIGGICGIVTSWNGFFVGASRVIFAMGRAKMIPEVFGKVHPKYQTPTAAIVLTGVICMITPLMGKKALVWFVDAASFGTVCAYLLVSLSFVAIRIKEPDLNRPYSHKRPMLAGALAVIGALFFFHLYLPIGASSLIWPHEWALVLGWVLIGIILAIAAKASVGIVSPAEREYLIFGKDYSRKEILGDFLLKNKIKE
ncbi:MAG: APC family permease [Eubacteriales bacterium]|nr:APC family permease [Eubacteriales bacterium]